MPLLPGNSRERLALANDSWKGEQHGAQGEDQTL